MDIYFKDNEHYDVIAQCSHEDMPILPNSNDKIWLNGWLYEVVKREFELSDSVIRHSFVNIYVKQ